MVVFLLGWLVGRALRGKKEVMGFADWMKGEMPLMFQAKMRRVEEVCGAARGGFAEDVVSVRISGLDSF